MGESCRAEHLYWTQFKVKRFCSVMSPAFHQRLKIPSRLLQCLKDVLSLTDSLLCGTAIVKGPSSKTWEMELIWTQDGLFFQNGWSDFVRDHNLQEGDILFFMYNGNLNFDVLIFDHESYCEKPCSHFPCCVSQRSLNMNHPHHVVQGTSSSQQPHTLPTPASAALVPAPLFQPSTSQRIPSKATNLLHMNGQPVEVTRSLNMNDPPSETTSPLEQAHTLPTPTPASQPEPPWPLQPSTSRRIPSEPISGKRKLPIDEVVEIESSIFNSSSTDDDASGMASPPSLEPFTSRRIRFKTVTDTSSTDNDTLAPMLLRPQSDDQFDLRHEKAKLEAKRKALQAKEASRFESVPIPMRWSSVSSKSYMVV